MQQEDRNRDERKLLGAARAASRHLPPGLPPVLYLTDPARTPDPATTATNLPAGWGIVYRHFGGPDRVDIACRLVSVARQRHLLVLIANDPELALEIGAHGIHWPFANRTAARKWQGAFPLMTCSAHTPDQLRQLQDAPFDAALLSTAFPSNSPSAGKAMGAVRLRQLARSADLPLYALGGITANTARMAAPVAGIAGIEGIESVFGSRI